MLPPGCSSRSAFGASAGLLLGLERAAAICCGSARTLGGQGAWCCWAIARWGPLLPSNRPLESSNQIIPWRDGPCIAVRLVSGLKNNPAEACASPSRAWSSCSNRDHPDCGDDGPRSGRPLLQARAGGRAGHWPVPAMVSFSWLAPPGRRDGHLAFHLPISRGWGIPG